MPVNLISKSAAVQGRALEKLTSGSDIVCSESHCPSQGYYCCGERQPGEERVGLAYTLVHHRRTLGLELKQGRDLKTGADDAEAMVGVRSITVF